MCDDGHDEIVYEGGIYTPCPLCAANKAIDDLKEQIEALEIQVTN
jgi:hypothetical protein